MQFRMLTGIVCSLRPDLAKTMIPNDPWLSEDEWQPELNEEFLSELGRILEGRLS